MKKILIDSGPMVALFDADDIWHDRVHRFLKNFKGELITSAANVTEAAWLTSSVSQTMFINLLTWLERGAVSIWNITKEDLKRIKSLALKYHDLDPDFADLALLALAEQVKVFNVLTIDQKDFDIYRLKNGKTLGNLLRATS